MLISETTPDTILVYKQHEFSFMLISIPRDDSGNVYITRNGKKAVHAIAVTAGTDIGFDIVLFRQDDDFKSDKLRKITNENIFEIYLELCDRIMSSVGANKIQLMMVENRLKRLFPVLQNRDTI